mgnify:FL=1
MDNHSSKTMINKTIVFDKKNKFICLFVFQMGVFRFGNAEYSSNFFAASICMFVSTLCCISAFASPYWTKRYLDTPKDFQNIGLWELCLYRYRHYKDDLQIPYTGCFWFWTNEMYRFRDWIIPRKDFEISRRIY